MNRTDPTTPVAPSPPWSATASVILAFIALAINEEVVARRQSGASLLAVPAILPIVLSTVAILLSFLFKKRLRGGSRGAWMTRGVVVMLTVAYAVATNKNITAFYYLNFASHAFGMIFVAESAIQHWQRPPRGQHRGAILVFLAAILFVIASRTYVLTFVKYLTPPFIALLALSMRASRPRAEGSSEGLHPWVAALFLAVFMGGAGALAVNTHSAELTRVLLSLLKPSSYSDLADANARPMLGRSFNQPLSQKRVMRVYGALAERHLRGMAFETYATVGGWGPAMGSRGIEDANVTLRARPGGQRLSITPLVENLTVLYVPLRMDGLDARAYKLLWAPDWGGAIFASSALSTYQPYEVAIVNDTHIGPLCKIMNEKLRADCVDLPPNIDPIVMEIAQGIEMTAVSPHDKLEGIRRYLYSNHSYSLTVDPGNGDPVANFLRFKKDGHCQYFASASVLIARSMGIPARYVTGFYAHESPEPEVTVVRQRDAHAWMEAWIDGEGWVTFDATPSGGMPGQAGGVSLWAKIWEKLGDWAEAFGAWMRQAPLSKLALLICVAALCGFAVRWFRLWRAAVKLARPLVTYSGAGRGFESLAAAFDDWLEKHDLKCPPYRPWLDHLAAQRRRFEKPSSPADLEVPKLDWNAAEAFARAYTAARFGGTADEKTLADLQRQLRALR